ncbi:MAG: hypothetical protein HRT87_03040 [Legionellales bacterium]|nr:hypothetical protein [Legionellales bacterium]
MKRLLVINYLICIFLCTTSFSQEELTKAVSVKDCSLDKFKSIYTKYSKNKYDVERSFRMAAFKDNLPVINFLIGEGVSISSYGINSQKDALYFAIKENNIMVAYTLVQNGAMPINPSEEEVVKLIQDYTDQDSRKNMIIVLGRQLSEFQFNLLLPFIDIWNDTEKSFKCLYHAIGDKSLIYQNISPQYFSKHMKLTILMSDIAKNVE